MKVLFVGGPKDGDVEYVSRVPVVAHDPQRGEGVVGHVIYDVTTLNLGGSLTMQIAVLGGMDRSDAADRVMAHVLNDVGRSVLRER